MLILDAPVSKHSHPVVSGHAGTRPTEQHRKVLTEAPKLPSGKLPSIYDSKCPSEEWSHIIKTLILYQVDLDL